MEFVALFTVILFIVAMAKIMKSYELAESLKPASNEIVPESENKNTALVWLIWGGLFLFSVFYQMYLWGDLLLPTSASEHGIIYDELFDVTMVLILVIFFICEGLMFWFCFKYYSKAGRKAFWFPHNNRLEVAWTVVPSIVLVLLISYGLSVWDDIMRTEKESYTDIELYAEQFSWSARYPGKDGKLGQASFTLLSPTNGLGLITGEKMDEREAASIKLIAKLEADTAELNEKVRNGWNVDATLSDKEDRLSAEHANQRRLARLRAKHAVTPFVDAEDDHIVKNKFVIPNNKRINFQMRSKDIIHSAFMPHFRAQINCVPGMKTKFSFVPIMTTEEMRKELNDPEFDYYLLCNKICGASHYNMKMIIEVVEEDDYKTWLTTEVYKETLDATSDVMEIEVEEDIASVDSTINK